MESKPETVARSIPSPGVVQGAKTSAPGTPARKASLGRRVIDVAIQDKLALLTLGADLAADANFKKILLWDLDDFATALAGPNPSAIETTLAESATIAWYVLRYYEKGLLNGLSAGSSMTARQSEFQEKRIERATRRLQSLLTTLANVKRLAVPVLKLNMIRLEQNALGAKSVQSVSAEIGSIPTPTD